MKYSKNLPNIRETEYKKEEILALTSVYYGMKMNLTVNENETAIQDLHCSERLLGINQKIIISAFNIPLSITAVLGNILIIIALQKP